MLRTRAHIPALSRMSLSTQSVCRSLLKLSLRRCVTSVVRAPSKSGYPERLLIYHAGTGRTVFIGCLKITTIFLFSFSCLVVAPSFYYAPDEPNWATAAVIIGGAIPMLFVLYTTAPFVSYAHIRLPIYARQSREQLWRWAQRLPRNTEIDLTTMRLYGGPRVSRMLISDLQPTKARLGVANLAKKPPFMKPINKRHWWNVGEANLFYIGEERKNQEPILQKVFETLQKA